MHIGDSVRSEGVAGPMGPPMGTRMGGAMRGGPGGGGWLRVALCGLLACGTGRAVADEGGPLGSESYPMVRVPAGTYTLGCAPGTPECQPNEVQRVVTLTYEVAIGQTEVTQRLWRSVMGKNPADHRACPNCPVEQISWYDAVQFANRMSVQEGLPVCYQLYPGGENPTLPGRVDWPEGLACTGYRLPTEAEWEVAAQAGWPAVPRSHAEVEPHAWYSGNGSYKTHPVGHKQPNVLGLFDMYGNVWEWVWDRYTDLPTEATDPTGPDTGDLRGLRGCSFFCPPDHQRASLRGRREPEYRFLLMGLRLARRIP